jgi:hypothetical protein
MWSNTDSFACQLPQVLQVRSIDLTESVPAIWVWLFSRQKNLSLASCLLRHSNLNKQHENHGR